MNGLRRSRPAAVENVPVQASHSNAALCSSLLSPYLSRKSVTGCHVSIATCGKKDAAMRHLMKRSKKYWIEHSRTLSLCFSKAGEINWSRRTANTSPVMKWLSVPLVKTYALPWLARLNARASWGEILPSGKQKATGPGAPSENDEVSTWYALT